MDTVRTEVLKVPPGVDAFYRRIDNGSLDGHFAMLFGESGTARNAASHLLVHRLLHLPIDVTCLSEPTWGGRAREYLACSEGNVGERPSCALRLPSSSKSRLERFSRPLAGTSHPVAVGSDATAPAPTPAR